MPRGMLHQADRAIDLAGRLEGRGRIVLTASGAMEHAFEDAALSQAEGQPSVFTRALVQGLQTGDADRDGDGHISVDELEHPVAGVRLGAVDELANLLQGSHPGSAIAAHQALERPQGDDSQRV
jgi:hypothetical protein